MKRGLWIISGLFAVLFLSFSCGGSLSPNGEAGKCLARLDSLVEADADSALVVMGRTPSDGWSRRDAMRLELLRAKAMNRADSLFTTDSLMLQLVKYYQRHGSRNDRMLSLYLLGCTYRDMGAAPRAIETWQKAVAEADTTRQDCDLSTLMRIHSQMNVLYIRQRLPEYAQQEAEQAEAICWKMKDTLNAMLFQQDVCLNLYNNGKYKECIEHTLGLYNQYLNIGQKDKAALVCVYCIKSYLALGEYGKAKEYIDIYETCSYLKTNPRKINGGLAPYYIYKGNYYLGIGNIDSAECCFRKAMPEMHLLHNDVDVYYRLYQIYAQRQQLDSTLKYVHLYAQAKERKFEDLKTQAALEAKNLYDYSVEQRIAREKTAANSKLQSWIYRICIIMLLFAVFVTYNFIKKKAREKEERTKYQLLILDYIKTVEELGTQKQQLKALLIENEEIIKDKNNNEAKIEELSAEKANLEALIRELEGKRAPMEAAIAQNAKRLNDSNIISYFRKHLEHPQQYPIMPEHFKKLQDEIEYDFPTFFLQTHSRGHISDTEYCLCLLIKAGFSVKHINLLLGKNDYASSTRRRLLMKIYGENGSPEDFDNKIRAII